MRFRPVFALLFVLGLAAGACQEVSAPASDKGTVASVESPNALLGGIIGSFLGLNDTVVVLQRAKALPEDISVTRTIGYLGGSISVPGTGLTVTVPKGAVSLPTTFTVKALAGRAVAYEFGPHGMEFDEPLRFEQDLRVSALTQSQLDKVKLEGGYFAETSDLLTNLLRAVVQELLTATVDSGKMLVSFEMKHFSGYLVAVEAKEQE